MPDNVFGLSSPSTPNHRVRREERIKIRKGEIVKEQVWLDTHGNELEMIRGGEFQVRTEKNVARKGPIIRGYPDPPVNTQTIPIELQFYPKKQNQFSEPYYYQPSVILVTCMAFLFWFLAGYALGRRTMLKLSAAIELSKVRVGVPPTEPTEPLKEELPSLTDEKDTIH